MSVKMASYSDFSLWPSAPVIVIDLSVALAVLPDEISNAVAALIYGAFLTPGAPVLKVTPSWVVSLPPMFVRKENGFV